MTFREKNGHFSRIQIGRDRAECGKNKQRIIRSGLWVVKKPGGRVLRRKAPSTISWKATCRSFACIMEYFPGAHAEAPRPVFSHCVDDNSIVFINFAGMELR